MINGLRLSTFLIVLGCFMCSMCFGQEKAQNRRKWIDSGAPVTNYPRRIPIPDAPQGPEGTIVLTNGRIFDGTGTSIRNGTLVIERNRIKDILPPGSNKWPDDARVIDVDGKTIMSGLIDLHVHITEGNTHDSTPDPSMPGYVPSEDEVSVTTEADHTLVAVERVRYYIESGITSIRDLSSHGMIPFRIKEWVRRNRIPGPRIFAAGQFITATGGHGAEGTQDYKSDFASVRTADGPDEWRYAVREQFNKGADVIKIGSHFSQEEVKAAVDEAHAPGLKVTVDAETFYIEWAVEAGADIIEHPLPRTDRVIRLMAEKGTQSDPTLIPYLYIFGIKGGYHGSTSRRFTFSPKSIREILNKNEKCRNYNGYRYRFMVRYAPVTTGAVHIRAEGICTCRFFK